LKLSTGYKIPSFKGPKALATSGIEIIVVIRIQKTQIAAVTIGKKKVGSVKWIRLSQYFLGKTL
jgi:hypothetical protein